VTIGHRIRLVPTAEQAIAFRRACGVSRFAYNWALAEWRLQYEAGEKPSEIALRKRLNSIKAEQFPWMVEVTKNAPQQAIKNLGKAYANFFADLKKYRLGELAWKHERVPMHKKKGRHDSFRADNGPDKNRPDAVQAAGKAVRLPVIGWVKMREEVRFAGHVLSVTVSRQADAWFASFGIEVSYEVDPHVATPTVGVDLGVSRLATVSDGAFVPASNPLRRYLKKLKRLSRSLSRKKIGSCNRAKAKIKLARLHRRISDIRADLLHKFTTSLTRHQTVVIEDLNVRGMLANRKLSRAIADVGFFEFRRQLIYKAKMSDTSVVIADRWYPSSKLCSACDAVNSTLPLAERNWTCVSCLTSHDRDFNAAVNLARYPESSPGSAHGAAGADVTSYRDVKPAA
jgi:putative transposase